MRGCVCDGLETNDGCSGLWMLSDERLTVNVSKLKAGASHLSVSVCGFGSLRPGSDTVTEDGRDAPPL